MPLQLDCKIDILPLKQAFAGLTEKLEGAIRPAAQAGAQVFYDEVLAKTPAKTGRLKSAIYQKFVAEESIDGIRAAYKISWRTGYRGAVLPSVTYGHFFEYGWWQRYEMARNEAGEFIGPMRQPGTEGKKKPSRRASQAERDAYWVPKKGGPVWHLPIGMVRNSYESKMAAAVAAIKAKLIEEVSK